MYRVCKLNFTIFDQTEDRKKLLEEFLSTLRMNGQILTYTIVDDGESSYAIAVAADDDALDEGYYDCYTKKYLTRLGVAYEVLGTDVCATDCCHCGAAEYYLLRADYDEISSPVICGDCGREIPLYRIPYVFGEEEHFRILSWQEMYQRVEGLWLDGLSDRFTKRQMIDVNSQLNRQGAELCTELERKLQRPVFLYVRNPIGGWYQAEKNNRILQACPKCGKNLRTESSVSAGLCDQCRLAFPR